MPEQAERTTTKRANMIKALHQSLGIVTPALKGANVGRATFYGWLKEDVGFAREVAEAKQMALDFAETELHKAIKKGNMTAIIFYLKCQAKGRGYIERQEVEQTITIDHTGKVATYHLPDNGRGPKKPEEKPAASDSSEGES